MSYLRKWKERESEQKVWGDAMRPLVTVAFKCGCSLEFSSVSYHTKHCASHGGDKNGFKAGWISFPYPIPPIKEIEECAKAGIFEATWHRKDHVADSHRLELLFDKIARTFPNETE